MSDQQSSLTKPSVVQINDSPSKIFCDCYGTKSLNALIFCNMNFQSKHSSWFFSSFIEMTFYVAPCKIDGTVLYFQLKLTYTGVELMESRQRVPVKLILKWLRPHINRGVLHVPLLRFAPKSFHTMQHLQVANDMQKHLLSFRNITTNFQNEISEIRSPDCHSSSK